ncbi:hypothetical protein D6792_02625 [Candidatus Parcubacteria bacterium]|nr:MAG: hypothetical protein D6792_02625 [Candidatus Parcubacteria bacterium]
MNHIMNHIMNSPAISRMRHASADFRRRVSYAVARSLAATLIVLLAFVWLEPQSLRAVTATDSFLVTQTISTEIAFSTTAADVTMDNAIGSITGGNSSGSTYFIVKSNNASGFTLTAKASTQPAMQRIGGGYSIPDYATSTSPTDYNFANAATGNAHFGFSYAASSSAGVHPDFLNDGASSCASGSTSTVGKCWRGFQGTTPITLFSSSAPTPNSGATSTMSFKVSVGASNPQLAAGTYQATITLTATTN